MAIGLTNADEVKAVQEWLNKNGFKDAEGNALVVDGRLGPRTRNAIKLAQQYLQSEGLYSGKIDGIVGQQTIDAMNGFTNTGGLGAVYNTADLGSFYTGNQKSVEASIIGGPLVSGSELPIREKVNKAKEVIASKPNPGVGSSNNGNSNKGSSGSSEPEETPEFWMPIINDVNESFFGDQGSSNSGSSNTVDTYVVNKTKRVPVGSGGSNTNQRSSLTPSQVKINTEGYPVHVIHGLFKIKGIYREDPETGRRSYLRENPNGKQYWDNWE